MNSELCLETNHVVCRHSSIKSLSVITTHNGPQLCFSHAWLEFTGCKEEQLQKKWFDLVHPEDRSTAKYCWDISFKENIPYTMEYRVLDRNGEYHWFLTEVVPIDNDMSGVVGISIDITAAKTSEHLFDHLERFMSRWADDPVGLCHFAGRAIGRIAFRNLDQLFLAIGASYFGYRLICDRIDYLYDHYQDPVEGELEAIFHESARLWLQKRILCIEDISARHHSVKMALIRDSLDGYSYFSIRYFVNKDEELSGYLEEIWDREHPVFGEVIIESGEKIPRYRDDYHFWNFRRPKEITHGVIVYPESDGFFNLAETKSVADLICLVSNLLKFK